MKKKIHIQYYALLREERKLSEETLTTQSKTVLDLYQELKKKYRFSLNTDILRVAINNEFSDWKTVIKNNDQIVFIPPVAGG
jgi:molybdopterin synthase sulfur carrier subunit